MYVVITKLMFLNNKSVAAGYLHLLTENTDFLMADAAR